MALKLNSSSRKKKRHLLITGASKEQIEQIILDYIGILGWAKAAPFFVKSDSNEVILSVSRSEVEAVKAAFALSPLPATVLRISGTLKGLKKKK